MGNQQEHAASRSEKQEDEEAPPPYQQYEPDSYTRDEFHASTLTYEPAEPGPSTWIGSQTGNTSVPSPSTSYKSGQSAGPTVDAPFDFPPNTPTPTNTPPPSYSLSPAQSASSSTSITTPTIHRPVAIPQTRADPASPLLPAYAPALLPYGIPAGTWLSFLDTLSAFLAARVPERAVAHAADIGRSVGDVPKRFGKDTVAHAKGVGRNIGDAAKRGNVVGAAAGVITGTVALPLFTALRAVGAVSSLPTATATAVARKPATPRERAEAYVAVANKKWFLVRGLRAAVVDSVGLCGMVGIPVERLVDEARGRAMGGVGAQIEGLEEYVAGMEVQWDTAAVRDAAALDLGAKTLWLVMVQGERVE